MTRDALQTLSQAKVKNENKFIKFGLLNARLGLPLALLSAVLAVTLKVLTVMGVIALSSSMMAVPGLGFFVIGLALTAIGILYLRKHRPNIFKCYLHGVQFRIGFAGIAAKIRSIQLHREAAKVHRLELSSARYEQLKGLIHKKKTLDKAQYNPEWHHELDKLLKNIAKKIDHFEQLNAKDQRKNIYSALNDKISNEDSKLEKARAREAEVQEKCDYWEGEDGYITKLKQRLHEASNKDFAKQTRLDDRDISQILAEGLQAGSVQWDKEMIVFLSERMGVDLRKCIKDDGDVDQDKLKLLFENYFRMDEAEMGSFIKKKLDHVSL
jgi:hypothetical protein